MIGPERGHVTPVLTSDWPQPPHQRRDAAEPQDRRDRAVRVRQGRVQPHPQEWSHRRGSLHHSRQKWSRGNVRPCHSHTIVKLIDDIAPQDPVAMAASGDGVPVFKFPGWRRKGVVKEEVRCRYAHLRVDINMLCFCLYICKRRK